MNDDNKTRETASDTITARVTPSTKEEYERVLAEMEGDSKTEKFRNFVRIVGEANTLTAKTGDDRSEYEEFLLHTTRLAEVFDSLLKKKNELKDQIYLEFQAKIETKDKSLADLQAKYDLIEKVVDEQKATISQLQPIVDKVDLYNQEKEKAIQDSEKAVREADELKTTLTGTIASQSIQIQELQDSLIDLPKIKEDKHQIQRELEKLQDKLSSKEDKIGELCTQIAELQEALKEEKELRKKDKDDAILKAARQAEDARIAQDQAVEKAQEKESQRWQSQVDRLDKQLEEERRAHAKDFENLNRLKLTKELVIDPELVSLKETVAELEKELEKAKAQIEKQKVQEDQKADQVIVCETTKDESTI